MATKTYGGPHEIPAIAAWVQKREAEILAAKAGITVKQLMALRANPDKQWARMEMKRLLSAKGKR